MESQATSPDAPTLATQEPSLCRSGGISESRPSRPPRPLFDSEPCRRTRAHLSHSGVPSCALGSSVFLTLHSAACLPQRVLRNHGAGKGFPPAAFSIELPAETQVCIIPNTPHKHSSAGAAGRNMGTVFGFGGRCWGRGLECRYAAESCDAGWRSGACCLWSPVLGLARRREKTAVRGPCCGHKACLANSHVAGWSCRSRRGRWASQALA